MTPILTASEMRDADRAATESLGIPSLLLMENAARGACDALLGIIEDVEGLAVLIVCGKGNNGGDGLALARHLHIHGADVTCALLSLPEELSVDAAAQYRMLHSFLPDAILPWEEVLASDESFDVVVDAMLGTGAGGTLRDPYDAAVTWANELDGLKVALDIPTGIDSDTGILPGTAFVADATVTMAALKPGLLLNDGPGHSGDLYVAHIGAPGSLYADARLTLLDDEWTGAWLPAIEHRRNKYDRGKVLVIAGSPGMTGAGVMAAAAALRAGAGLVVCAMPDSTAGSIPQTIPSEAMTRFLPAGEDGAFSTEALTAIEEELTSYRAIAIGPGLSKSEGAAAMVRALLQAATCPVVLDADGLSAFNGKPEEMVERTSPLVITPHHGEMARLLGMSSGEIAEDPIRIAREAATRCNAIAVLKGAPTVVALPNGRAWINGAGNPGMAGGGVGDVLTGMIASLIAQTGDAEHGTLAAVYLHSLAGDVAAELRGVRSLMAGDIIESIPSAYRALREEG